MPTRTLRLTSKIWSNIDWEECLWPEEKKKSSFAPWEKRASLGFCDRGQKWRFVFFRLMLNLCPQRQVRHPFVHDLQDCWQTQRHLYISESATEQWTKATQFHHPEPLHLTLSPLRSGVTQDLHTNPNPAPTNAVCENFLLMVLDINTPPPTQHPWPATACASCIFLATPHSHLTLFVPPPPRAPFLPNEPLTQKAWPTLPHPPPSSLGFCENRVRQPWDQMLNAAAAQRGHAPPPYCSTHWIIAESLNSRCRCGEHQQEIRTA